MLCGLHVVIVENLSQLCFIYDCIDGPIWTEGPSVSCEICGQAFTTQKGAMERHKIGVHYK